MANALNRHEGLPQRFTPAIVRRDAFGRRKRLRVVVAEIDRRVVGYAATVDGYNTDLAAQWGVRGSNTRAKRFYRGLGARLGRGSAAALLTGRALAAVAAAR
jgi:hypothetical protein